MHNISLLPKELKLKRINKQKNKKYVLLFSISLLFPLLISFSLMIINTQVKTKLTKIQAERMALEEQAASLKKYEALQNQLIYVNNTYKKIMNNVPDFKGILVDLAHSLPEGVSLTDITTSSSSVDNSVETGGLTIKGHAVNYSLAAVWLGEMQQMPYLKNVNINSLAKENIENQELIQFEIKATVKPGNFTIPFLKGEN